MKRYFLIFAALLCCSAFVTATPRDNGLLGVDAVYSFDVSALTPAPEGYEPVYIEHYGRHGSRYAYDQKYYADFKAALDRGEAAGLLTPLAQRIKKDYDSHYERYTLRMGDLTPLGWEQLQRIGQTMYGSFPTVFAEGASVYACASNSIRSIMSMSGFCLGLRACNADMPIYEEQGIVTLNVTHPRSSQNPYAVRYPKREFPFSLTLSRFMDTQVDVEVILHRLFTDPAKALNGKSRHKFIMQLYQLEAGMASIPGEERTDFTGIFTDSEFAGLYKTFNYKAYMSYYSYPAPCSAVVEDMIAGVEDALATGRRGLRARFGHDHVVAPIVCLLGLGRYCREAESPEDVINCFNISDVTMASNVQIVFYKGNGPVLVKALFNGVEMPFTHLSSVSGPYYSWDEVKPYILKKIEAVKKLSPEKR